MPIKGLTDQQAALPIIGMLRKGDEKPAKGPGKDLTYFRFTADDAATVQQFTDAYGPEPRQINVFLPFKTTDENMDAWIEKWVAGGLEYRSDGQTVVLYRISNGYATDERPDPQPEILEDGKRSDGSMQVGRLSVIVPEMGRLATVTVLTTSKHDIINLTRQLRSIEAINGDLRGIPFVLRRSPKMISTPAGNGKRARREKWLLSIETHKRGTMAILGNMERTALAELAEFTDDEPAQVVYQLPPGVSDPFDGDITPPPAPVASEPVQVTTPQKKNGNGKRDEWRDDYPPHIASFVNDVRAATDYYTGPHHLYNTVGGWPKPNDDDEYSAKLSAAIDHAEAKAQAAIPASQPDLDEVFNGQ